MLAMKRKTFMNFYKKKPEKKFTNLKKLSWI